MNIIKNGLFLHLITILLLSSVSHANQIFKCVNAKEEVYYNDKPCPIGNTESKISAIKDPENGYIPPKFIPEKLDDNNKGVVVGNSSKRSIVKNEDSQSEEHIKGNAKSVSSSNEKNNSQSKENTSGSNENVANNNYKSSSQNLSSSDGNSDSDRTNKKTSVMSIRSISNLK